MTGPGFPDGFVYLRDVAPRIIQDVRYYGSDNFVGRRVAGYEAAECVMTWQAAQALKAVDDELRQSGLALKVFDCYRPQQAVNDFIVWGRDVADQRTKAVYYPNLEKADLFDLGYIATKSSHTRGSTTDLTVVRLVDGALPSPPEIACTAPSVDIEAGELDFGTAFDCFDELSHTASPAISSEARENREMLLGVMERHGFENFEKEWWHFTLKGEPFPDTYFDFPIR